MSTDRSDSLERRPSPPDRRPLVVAGAVLAVAIVVPLAVPLYARLEPELWGVPFFFWFQFALVFLSVVSTSVAYVLVGRYDRRRHAADAELRRRDGGAGGAR